MQPNQSQNDVQSLDLSSLKTHPWQSHVPNLEGKDWHAFYKDVELRGVQEPISVSTRTGEPVIVDGHQRVRVARSLGLTHISAIVRPFADEGEEVTFLAGAARFRRHLNDYQRVEIGKAYETYFRPIAAERVGGRPKKEAASDLDATLKGESEPQEKPSLNLDKVTRADTTKEAADAVGMSRAQYAKAKQVSERASEPVKQAWAQGQLSTHAAHDLTKASDPIRQAIHDKAISPQQAVAIQRDKVLKAQVISGKTTPVEAAKLSDVMQEQLDEENRVMGRDMAFEAHTDLTRITDRSVDEWLEAMNTRMNLEVWKGTLIDDLREVISHLQAVEREALTVVT